MTRPKISLFLTVLGLLSISCASRNAMKPTSSEVPEGAWSRQLDQDGKNLTEVLLLIDGFYSVTAHESANGAFIMTKGGSYRNAQGKLLLHQEFHSTGSAALGAKEEWTLKTKGKDLMITTGSGTAQWAAMDKGQTTALTGAWLFSGRERDGAMQRRDTNVPRKTMKLLTGNRFQWIAFNTETGEFFGTGGGEYTADNGAYIEKIRFFSRNNDRVGAELPFQFSTEGADWHHRGNSSSGEPMYEIWSKRQE